MLHNDDGAIGIEYSLLSGDAQAFDRELTDGLEVAVEVSDGTGYREPDNARFSSPDDPARPMTGLAPSPTATVDQLAPVQAETMIPAIC